MFNGIVQTVIKLRLNFLIPSNTENMPKNLTKSCIIRYVISGDSVVKNQLVNTGDAEDSGSISGSRRFPG